MGINAVIQWFSERFVSGSNRLASGMGRTEIEIAPLFFSF